MVSVRAGRLGTVILFAREARLGRGKRRLARTIGTVGAHRFYRSALAGSLRTAARQQGWRALVTIDPATAVRRPGRPFVDPPAARLPQRGQRGRDLGERMARALASAPPGPVVLIGADIPGVRPELLRQALKLLGAADLVLGPSLDGGFWLIGVKRRPSPRFLDGIAWSTPQTRSAVIASVPRAWRVREAATLADVDHSADLPANFSYLLKTPLTTPPLK